MYISISASNIKLFPFPSSPALPFQLYGCWCWWCLAINKIIWLHTRRASNGFSLLGVCFWCIYRTCTHAQRMLQTQYFSHRSVLVGRECRAANANLALKWTHNIRHRPTAPGAVNRKIFIDWKWSAVIIIKHSDDVSLNHWLWTRESGEGACNHVDCLWVSLWAYDKVQRQAKRH